MFQKLLRVLDQYWPAQTVYAHCDIPCGLYASHPAQMAADTVLKMVEKILALPSEGSPEELLQAKNSLVRMVMVKEEHAQICKKELLILWTDYFKEEHLKIFPNLHDTFWKAAKLCSQNKQKVNLETAKKLQEVAHEIGHMFEKAEEIKKRGSA